MKKDQTYKKLRIIIRRQKQRSDIEADHLDADKILLERIGDEKVTRLYEKIVKWYA